MYFYYTYFKYFINIFNCVINTSKQFNIVYTVHTLLHTNQHYAKTYLVRVSDMFRCTVSPSSGSTYDAVAKQIMLPEDSIIVGRKVSEPKIKYIFAYCWFVSSNAQLIYIFTHS